MDCSSDLRRRSRFFGFMHLLTRNCDLMELTGLCAFISSPAMLYTLAGPAVCSSLLCFLCLTKNYSNGEAKTVKSARNSLSALSFYPEACPSHVSSQIRLFRCDHFFHPHPQLWCSTSWSATVRKFQRAVEMCVCIMTLVFVSEPNTLHKLDPP